MRLCAFGQRKQRRESSEQCWIEHKIWFMRLFHYDGNWRNKWLNSSALSLTLCSLAGLVFNILAAFAAHFFYFISSRLSLTLPAYIHNFRMMLANRLLSPHSNKKKRTKIVYKFTLCATHTRWFGGVIAMRWFSAAAEALGEMEKLISAKWQLLKYYY